MDLFKYYIKENKVFAHIFNKKKLLKKMDFRPAGTYEYSKDPLYYSTSC